MYKNMSILIAALFVGVCHGQAVHPPRKSRKLHNDQADPIASHIEKINSSLDNQERLREWANKMKGLITPLCTHRRAKESGNLFRCASRLSLVINNAQDPEKLRSIIAQTGLSQVLQRALSRNIDTYDSFKSLINILDRLLFVVMEFHPDFIQAWEKAYISLIERTASDHIQTVSLARAMHLRSRIQVPIQEEAWLDAWYAVITEKMQQRACIPVDLVNSIHGLARLGVDTTSNNFMNFMHAWYTAAIDRVQRDDFDILELSDSMYSLGKLEVAITDDLHTFVRSWCEAAHRSLSRSTWEFVPLANSIYGLGKLELDTTSEMTQFLHVWCKRAIQELQEKTTAVGSQPLANSVYGLGRLEADATRELASFLQEWYSVAKSKINHGMFEEVDLANCVYGLGKLEVEKTQEFADFMRAWYGTAISKVADDHFYPIELSNMLYGLGKLEVEKTQEFFQFLSAWYRMAIQKMQEDVFEPIAMSNCIYGLGKLGIAETEEFNQFLEIWYQRAKQHMKEGKFQGIHLANTVHGLAKLKVGMSQSFYSLIQTWYEAALSKVRFFKQRQLATATVGIAGLASPNGASRERFLNLLLSTITERLSELSEDARVGILHGLSLLHVAIDDPHVRTHAQNVAQQIIAHLDLTRIPQQKAKKAIQVIWALHYFDARYDELEDVSVQSAQTESRSQTESQVYDAFTLLHAYGTIKESPQSAYKIPEICTEVDMAFPHAQVVVEVDGPPHFFGASWQRVPKDALKDKLLRKLGWNVVRIPYYEWSVLHVEQVKAYLFSKLRPYGLVAERLS